MAIKCHKGISIFWDDQGNKFRCHVLEIQPAPNIYSVLVKEKCVIEGKECNINDIVIRNVNQWKTLGQSPDDLIPIEEVLNDDDGS